MAKCYKHKLQNPCLKNPCHVEQKKPSPPPTHPPPPKKKLKIRKRKHKLLQYNK